MEFDRAAFTFLEFACSTAECFEVVGSIADDDFVTLDLTTTEFDGDVGPSGVVEEATFVSIDLQEHCGWKH